MPPDPNITILETFLVFGRWNRIHECFQDKSIAVEFLSFHGFFIIIKMDLQTPTNPNRLFQVRQQDHRMSDECMDIATFYEHPWAVTDMNWDPRKFMKQICGIHGSRMDRCLWKSMGIQFWTTVAKRENPKVPQACSYPEDISKLRNSLSEKHKCLQYHETCLTLILKNSEPLYRKPILQQTSNSYSSIL